MCRMSERTAAMWVMVVAILMIVTSLSAISAAITGLTSKFMMFTNLHVLVGIMGIIIFLLLVAGGVVGICGVKKRKFSCMFAMFWLLVVAASWAAGMTTTMYGVWMLYSSNTTLTSGTCVQRFETVAELQYVGDTIAADLCTANCQCDLTGADSTYVGAAGNTGGSNSKV